MLIDTHCHLDFPQFEDNQKETIQNAFNAGVQKMITIGCHPKTFQKTIDIIEEYKNIFGAIGIHPCDISEENFHQEIEQIEMLLSHKKIVAIGETGLDFFREENPSKKIQYKSFEQHMEFSRKYKKPVIVHLRDAEKEAEEFFQNHHDTPFVLHCFVGNWEFAKKMLDFGAHLSFSGIITFKNCSEEHLEVVKKTPLDRIFVETDSPFLAPVPNRGKRNEPAFVVEMAKKIAELRGILYEDVCEQTTKNAENFFGI